MHLMTVITTTSAALKCSSKQVLHTSGFFTVSGGCLSNVKKLVVIVITAMMISQGCVAHHSPYRANTLDIFFKFRLDKNFTFIRIETDFLKNRKTLASSNCGIFTLHFQVFQQQQLKLNRSKHFREKYFFVL